jgi:hypothetical protein
VPVRLLDTRTSGQTLGPAGTLNLTVTGAEVPASAIAVALNLTVTDTTTSGYLSAYPAGASKSTVSNVDWVGGETVANSAIVPVGSGGQISLYNHTGDTDVVVDLDGYFASEPAGSGAGAYVPLAPSRIADTRPGSGRPDANSTLGSGGTLNVQVSGAGGVPAGATAAILNVTTTDTNSSSFLTIYPEGVTKPTASNLNWVPGETVANRVLAPLSSSGQVSVFNNSGPADVVVDVDGYFTNGAAALPATATLYTAITPTRVLDTRHGSGYPGAGSTLGAGAILPVSYSLLPSSVTAVVENLTATGTTAASFFTVYPSGGTRPTTSDLNWNPGQVVANLTVATLSGHEGTDIFNHAGSTNAIVDAFGYFSLYTPATAPTVSALTPTSGSVGTVVTVTGTGFSVTPGTTDFDFGAGNAATAVSCSSSTNCNATAPAGTGGVEVTASVGGLTSSSSEAVQFTYTVAIPPAPSSTQLQFTTEPSNSASSGEPFATSPVVDVDDASGVLVSGDSSLVTLAITTTSPAGSTLTCTSGESVTAVGGQAAFTGCQVTGPTGSYSLSATDGVLAPATSTAVAVGAGTPAALEFTGEPPSSASSGSALGAPMSVSVEDSFGNTVIGDSSPVTLAITSGSPSGSITCSGGAQVDASSGVATYSDCTITGMVGSYTLAATDGALTPAASTTITLGAGTASHLMFSAEPPGTADADVPFSGPVSVSVEDSSGNVLTSDNSSIVTLALDPSSPAGTSNCAGSPVQMTAGVATFTGCQITGADGTYAFDASDSAYSSLTAVSSSITLSGSSGNPSA